MLDYAGCSGQAYVAAFLAKSDKSTVEDSAAAAADKGRDKGKGDSSSSSIDGDGSGAAADSLYEVGTFAQVRRWAPETHTPLLPPALSSDCHSQMQLTVSCTPEAHLPPSSIVALRAGLGPACRVAHQVHPHTWSLYV